MFDLVVLSAASALQLVHAYILVDWQCPNAAKCFLCIWLRFPEGPFGAKSHQQRLGQQGGGFDSPPPQMVLWKSGEESIAKQKKTTHVYVCLYTNLIVKTTK